MELESATEHAHETIRFARNRSSVVHGASKLGP